MNESEVNSDWIDSEEEFNFPKEELSQQPEGEINSTVKECVNWTHYKTNDGYDFRIPNCDEEGYIGKLQGVGSESQKKPPPTLSNLSPQFITTTTLRSLFSSENLTRGKSEDDQEDNILRRRHYYQELIIAFKTTPQGRKSYLKKSHELPSIASQSIKARPLHVRQSVKNCPPRARPQNKKSMEVFNKDVLMIR
ncbi:hypothetical protein AgCh_015730 [Apium graveolens]